VLEAEFILLEPLSPSRRIFISSHSLPPLWFTVSVLQRAAKASGACGGESAENAGVLDLSSEEPNMNDARNCV
jgi:hypothetical protein